MPNLGFDPVTDFFFIAGPCLIESETVLQTVAASLAGLSARLGVPVVLKGSFIKANRTQLDSFSTIGPEKALAILAETGRHYGLKTLTDVHSVQDCELASGYADILQIPAFLCRQTDLLVAAGQTGLPVNIKKGQFAAPDDMRHAVRKVQSAGNNQAMVCERGTTFGYHDLVVDMRGLQIMRSCGVPVIFDATHSVQQPSAADGVSGGQPAFIGALARAACAVGVNGVFFETHPDPPNALSDKQTQIPLHLAESLMRQCLAITQTLRQLEVA